VRLVTVADYREAPDERDISVAARHEAVLDDGRRVVLLDDRGWSESLRRPGADGGVDVWTTTSEHEIAETARMVVGPDEPFGGRSQGDMEAAHWSYLPERLRAAGIAAEAADLEALPHEVVLSEGLRARLRRARGG